MTSTTRTRTRTLVLATPAVAAHPAWLGALVGPGGVLAGGSQRADATTEQQLEPESELELQMADRVESGAVRLGAGRYDAAVLVARADVENDDDDGQRLPLTRTLAAAVAAALR